MKSNKQLLVSYDIQLSTVTPVSIGNGTVYSPYIDYIFDKEYQQVGILDKKAIDQAVEEAELTEQYLKAIYASFDGNNKSSFNVESFLEKNLRYEVDDLVRRYIDCFGLRDDSRIRVNAMIKDQDQPYIPGSSIKGAIKTALLYHWLRTDGSHIFDNIMDETIQTYKKCKNEFQQLLYYASKMKGVKSYSDKRLRKWVKIIKNHTRSLNDKIGKKINQLLDSETKYHGKDFRHFRVGDSLLLNPEDCCFQKCQRLHYDKMELQIPIYLEAIPVSKSSRFRLNIVHNWQNKSLVFFNQKNAIEKLFIRLNTFSRHNIEIEQEYLQHFTDDFTMRVEDKNTRDAIETYYSFLEAQRKRVNECKANEAYLCLGYGKTFFHNSIGMLVDDWISNSELKEDDLSIFEKYTRLFLLGKPGSEDFPITRTLISKGLPLGWVKLVC